MDDDRWLTRFDALAAEVAAQKAWASTPTNQALVDEGPAAWAHVRARFPALTDVLDRRTPSTGALVGAWNDCPARDDVAELFPVVARALDRLAGRLIGLRPVPTREEVRASVERSVAMELMNGRLAIESKEARAAASRIASSVTAALGMG